MQGPAPEVLDGDEAAGTDARPDESDDVRVIQPPQDAVLDIELIVATPRHTTPRHATPRDRNIINIVNKRSQSAAVIISATNKQLYSAIMNPNESG